MMPAYLAELQAAFGWRAGRFTRAGTRASYPLKLTRAAAPVAGSARCSSATPRRRCTRWRARDSTWACAMRRCSRNCIAAAPGDAGAAELLQRFAAGARAIAPASCASPTDW